MSEKKRLRKHEKEFQKILYGDAVYQTDSNGMNYVPVSPLNLSNAEEYMVKMYHGLKDDEVANLDNSKYEELRQEAEKARKPFLG